MQASTGMRFLTDMVVPLWSHICANCSLADIWWSLLEIRLYVLSASPRKLKERPPKPVMMGSAQPLLVPACGTACQESNPSVHAHRAQHGAYEGGH